MRLDKMICRAGWGSRSEAKSFISKGRVSVNGTAARKSDTEIDISRDKVTLDGVDIDYMETYWVMLNKPKGVVSATDDTRDPTVLSLLDDRHKRMGLFPVGRLDKSSTGLILLTNDGQLGHRLLSPKSHVEKLYMVTVEGALTDNEISAFNAGITLADSTLLRPAGLELIETGATSRAYVRLTEGKYHQIKRMMGVLGYPVLELHRLAIGGLRLDSELPPGVWRRLKKPEIVRIAQMGAEIL